MTREQLQELVRQAESMVTRFSPIGGAGLGALARTIEEARQRQEQQPPTTSPGGQVSITIQRPEATPREVGREGGGGIRIGGGGGGGGDTEREEYWTWVIPYERRGFAVTTPPRVPIRTETETRTYTYTAPPPPTTYEAPATRTETEAPPVTTTQTPTETPPIPPTAVPPVPPFLIPLLWYPSMMPTQYPLAEELARPSTMREILVL